jgi:ribosomal protein L40E
MTDTITESFCERCGTRYPFERTAMPRRARIGRVRVLTRGLKNYVANDGMPMNEAMAAARGDEDRAGISRQLEAFHKTFNFCMSCRQYTCANCWNEKAGECLTCAPDFTLEVLPAPFPDLPIFGPAGSDSVLPDGEGVAAAAWPTADLARTTIGAATAPTMDAAPTPEVAASIEEPEVPARLEAFVAALAGAEPEELTAAERAEIETALAAAHPAVESPAEPRAEPEPAAAIEMATDAEPRAGGEPLVTKTVDHATATARGQTRSLLGRFRPGRRPVAASAAASTAAAADEVAVSAEPGIAPLAASEPAAEPVTEPETATVHAAEAAAEPVTEPETASEPAPADTIEQPTWRMVAPDVTPAPRPDWPDAPAWPSPDARTTQAASQVPGPSAAPWASRLATARPEPGGVWAASSKEVLAARGAVAASGPGPAVQACVSCGLSLSANARFCRRCGTRQA